MVSEKECPDGGRVLRCTATQQRMVKSIVCLSLKLILLFSSTTTEAAGNQRFRVLIDETAPLYVAARTKLEKTQVIANLVERVRNESPGGGFVKRDFHTGRWFEIGDDKARDKTGHAIRRAVEENGKRKGGLSKQATKKSRANEKASSTAKEESSSLAEPLTMLPSQSQQQPQPQPQQHANAEPPASLSPYPSQPSSNARWDSQLFSTPHRQHSIEQFNAASFIEQFMPGGSLRASLDATAGIPTPTMSGVGNVSFTNDAGSGYLTSVPHNATSLESSLAGLSYRNIESRLGRSFAAGAFQNIGDSSAQPGTAAAAYASHFATFGGGEVSALQFSGSSFATQQEDPTSCAPLSGQSRLPSSRPQSYLDIRHDHQASRNLTSNSGVSQDIDQSDNFSSASRDRSQNQYSQT
jgi:hypothetical protein